MLCSERYMINIDQKRFFYTDKRHEKNLNFADDVALG